MIQITLEDAVGLAEEVVAERGEDYVSPLYFFGVGLDAPFLTDRIDEHRDAGRSSCRYVRPDGVTPECIVGSILHKAGVAIEDILAQEGSGAHVAIHRLEYNGVVLVTEPAANFLATLQAEQDSGETWGNALRWQGIE